MKILFTIALFIVWLGFVLGPAIFGIKILIYGIKSILEIKEVHPKYRKKDLFSDIRIIFHAIFCISLSIVIGLLPFMNKI